MCIRDRLNAVATKSEDGKTLYFKAVNPTRQFVEVELSVEGDVSVKSASMQLVSPGDLTARNTLEEPNRIRPEPRSVQIEGKKVRFSLPALSAGVVTIEIP
ncbi:MAG: hypothetical protein N2116_05290, partial [Armatimonadetes bacterium]|nr:hypothetical protein [Armatimonadota bacterium]